jgi:hypothetical protein
MPEPLQAPGGAYLGDWHILDRQWLTELAHDCGFHCPFHNRRRILIFSVKSEQIYALPARIGGSTWRKSCKTEIFSPVAIELPNNAESLLFRP